jgi:DUF177 domain-containing protein
VLRLNVGFLLKEGIGYSREFTFDEPVVVLSTDLTVRDLHGSVTFTRTPQGLYSQGQLRATVDYECSRCLTDFDQPVSVRLAELYYYPPESAPSDAPTIGDDVHLDLTPVVREDFLVSIPIRALCRPDCKGLCPQCGSDWNEGPCDCRDDEIDPRLAVLAELLKKQDPEQEAPGQ